MKKNPFAQAVSPKVAENGEHRPCSAIAAPSSTECFLPRSLAFAFAFSFLITAASAVRAQEIPPIVPPGLKLPHIKLLSMGGTIASRGDTRLNIANYGGPGMPRVDPEHWIADLPDLALVANVTTEDFRPPQPPPPPPGSPPNPAATGGGGTTTEQLYKVARRLQELASDDTVDGIVVTHGTNTMAETAWFMNLVVAIKKPVVYVGSQRPWTGMSGDGPLNLYNAVRVAATPAAAEKGVLHCMNQNINAARDVTKLSAYRMDTFKSIDLGVLGVADPDVVKFYMEPTRRHTFKSEFNITSLPPDPRDLPAVECVYSYTEAPGYLIDSLIEHGVKGIIVDGTGAGSPTGGEKGQTEAIKRAQAKGIVVAVTARTRGGRVQDTPRRRDQRSSPPTISHRRKPACFSRWLSPRRPISPRSNASLRSTEFPSATHAMNPTRPLPSRSSALVAGDPLSSMSHRSICPSINRRDFIAGVAAVGTASALFAHRLRAEAAPAAKISDDPLFTSAKKIAAMIKAKKISATEVVTAHIKRIEAVNPQLNAVVFPTFERALTEARFADEATAAGRSFGPLHGVPCTMKDSHEVLGVVSTGGTLGRKGYIPSRDATYVARVRAAGAIILGKTNTPELTLSGQTTNLIYGKTHNPYKLGYQPGGSTGGGASIIAAGGSPFDIGTDFGGSIRGPAHFCGIAGIKPTTGRVPRTGHIVDYGGYFDAFQVIGPMARWVEDLELIMPLISGPDFIDAAIAPAPWLEPKDVDLKKIKVVYYLNNGSEKPLTPETETAVKATVKLFSDLGVTVVEDCPKALIRETQDLRLALSTADGRAWTKRMLKKYGTTQVSPVISLTDSPPCDVAEFTRLADALDVNRSKFLQWIKPYDLLICPANRTPAEPWPEELKPQVPDPKNIGFTTTYNNTGWPGTVVRAGFSPEGLPIGVQLLAHPWREDVSLAAAAFVEAASGFGYQKPTAV